MPQDDDVPSFRPPEEREAIPAVARTPAFDLGTSAAFARRQPAYPPVRHNPTPALVRPPLAALRSVLQETESEARSTGGGPADATTLPAGSLTILSSGGGVGTTTVLATLGRIFALRRERVLLLEGTSSSVLPFYFGADQAASGSWLFRERHDSTEHSIRVIARRREVMTDPGAETADRQESDQSLFANLESHLGTVDRVLVDAWSQMAGAVQKRLLHETSILVLLVPDLRSAVRVRALLQFFEEQRRLTDLGFTAHFLINQFDSRLPLHQELHRSLSSQLGDRLLPFTVRRTDEISLALAEGVSIVDYAPDSDVSHDFLRLADWLSMWQGTQADLHREHRAARGQR